MAHILWSVFLSKQIHFLPIKKKKLRKEWARGELKYMLIFWTTAINKCLLLCLIIVQFSSVTQSCPTLCDPMNRSTPGLPIHHQLPEFTQTHIHRVSDAIHPLSSPYPPAPNPSQHQSLFQWVNSLTFKTAFGNRWCSFSCFIVDEKIVAQTMYILGLTNIESK